MLDKLHKTLIFSANSVDLDQMACHMVSDLSLDCSFIYILENTFKPQEKFSNALLP